MKVKFISDFHTEFWEYNKIPRLLKKYLPPTDDDKDTILCCLGDMGTYAKYASTYKPLFKLLSKRFREVLVVPGNHSWYGSVGIWGNEAAFFRDCLPGDRSGQVGSLDLPDNVRYLDNDYVIIDGVAFIGSCLWTDFDGGDELAMFHAQRGMNDFVCIRTEGRVYQQSPVITPEDTVARHHKSVRYITDTLGLFHGKKCVVLTHHAPCAESTTPRYRGDLLNAAFVTDLTEIMLQYEPLIWAHGHMHSNSRYKIGSTEVICNPLGYHPSQINRGFDPALSVNI